jgi:hypothetical protein
MSGSRDVCGRLPFLWCGDREMLCLRSSFPFRNCLSHSFSTVVSNRKLRQKEKASRFAQKIAQTNELNLPTFHALLRQLYRKIHPDLVRSHSETMSKVNDTSMQELNGVLSTVKTVDYPRVLDKRFIFYAKDINSIYQPHELHLKTSGGDCRKQLKGTFEVFFKRVGILATDGGSFRWDAEYFPVLKYSDLVNEESSTSPIQKE